MVSTTHLLFNPKREDVRLAQTQLLLSELDMFSRDSIQSDRYIPIIITGDFNMIRKSKVFKLLSEGIISTTGVRGRLNVSNPKSSLLPPEVGITDDCRYIDPVISKKNNNNEKLDEEIRTPLLLNTGKIMHNLNLISTTDAKIAPETCTALASTYHGRWIMVDYIFFNEHYSHGNHTSPKLKLLQNLRLPSEEDCMLIGPIPNSKQGSDHYPVVTTFSLS